MHLHSWEFLKGSSGAMIRYVCVKWRVESSQVRSICKKRKKESCLKRIQKCSSPSNFYKAISASHFWGSTESQSCYVELYDFRRVHFLKEAPRFAAPKLEGDPKIESHEIKVAATEHQQIGGQFCNSYMWPELRCTMMKWNMICTYVLTYILHLRAQFDDRKNSLLKSYFQLLMSNY